MAAYDLVERRSSRRARTGLHFANWSGAQAAVCSARLAARRLRTPSAETPEARIRVRICIRVRRNSFRQYPDLPLVEYVRCVSRIEHLARTYWFDLLIALLAIVAMLNVVLGRGSSGAPTTTLWFCLPALAILVLPVFARRWFPFAGPAAYWLLAAGISFVNPLLIPYPESLFLMGLAVAFLLGNLRDVRRAGLGLAIVVGAAATLVYNIPGHSVEELVFVPVDFAVAWVAGLAVRARAEQAEVAESRAIQAEHAVFEERVRIARELHDVVAHHVSMMGVQAGAARVVIDRDRIKAKESLTAIEVSSRQAVGELHRLLGFLRQAGRPGRSGSAPWPEPASAAGGEHE